MKKIVSVLLLLALVFGAVYAQSVSLNYRTQAELFNYNADTEKFTLLDNDAYGDAKDSLTFNMSGKAAGVKLVIQPTLKDKSFVLNCYEGWLKFGNVKIGGGYWADGSFRANRITTDAGNWAGKDFEKNKIGIANGALGKGIDSIVNGKNLGKAQATYVEYAPKFGDSTVTVKLANVTSSTDFDTKGADANFTFTNEIGAILAYNLKSVVDVEFVARFFNEEQSAFGLYVQPLMVKGLTVTLGGAIGIDANKDNNEMGFDLRARYAVNKQLSLTTMHNFSISNAEAQYLWNMVNAKYVLNDVVALQLNFSHENTDLSDSAVDSTIRITPGVVFTATDGASITTGVAVEIKGDVTVLSMPMVLRVKM